MPRCWHRLAACADISIASVPYHQGENGWLVWVNLSHNLGSNWVYFWEEATPKNSVVSSSGGRNGASRGNRQNSKLCLSANIGQAEIDAASQALYPTAMAATRKRQVYIPISAVLRHAARKGW